MSVLGSALAGVAISFGEGGLVWATIAMTVLLVVFAEVMPKTYAFAYADRYIAHFSCLEMGGAPVKPTIRRSKASCNQMIRPNPIAESDRQEELRGLIELQGDDGNADDRERKAMLSSILDLNELSVDQIMTHRGARMVNADDHIDDILRNILSSPHTPSSFLCNTVFIGVLHVKDLLRALGEVKKNGKIPILPKSVQNIASVYFIPETTLLFDQLQAFRARREHFAVVVDEYGDFRGIVTYIFLKKLLAH